MNKVFFSAIALILSSLSLFSQETIKKKKAQNIYFAPSIGTEIMNIKKYTSSTNGYTVMYKGLPSLRYGLDMNIKKSEKLVIQTGLYYSAKNLTRNETNPENSNYYNSRFRNRYLESLIGGTYNFTTGRLDAGLYGNFNFSFLTSASESRLTETGNSYTYNLKPYYSKMLGSFEPGLNFNYNINYRLSFGLKSGYRLYFNSLPIKKEYSQNSLLVQSGVFFKF
ncbi:MAG TPA: outer membrane beta-barrel protein [Flavobacteriales bacterium]|nr:outer membrane beta-barrel protein [Flavobacteriales bacterium]